MSYTFDCVSYTCVRLGQLAKPSTATCVRLGQLAKPPTATCVRLGQLAKPSTATCVRLGQLAKPSTATCVRLGQLAKPSTATRVRLGQLANPSTATCVRLGQLAKPSTAPEGRDVEADGVPVLIVLALWAVGTYLFCAQIYSLTIHSSLLAFFICVFSFIRAVSIYKCWGQHTRISSTFS